MREEHAKDYEEEYEEDADVGEEADCDSIVGVGGLVHCECVDWVFGVLVSWVVVSMLILILGGIRG